MGLKADLSNLEARASSALRIRRTLRGCSSCFSRCLSLWLARLPTLRNLITFPESGSVPNAQEQMWLLFVLSTSSYPVLKGGHHHLPISQMSKPSPAW